ncbi:NERD domain-containing protein [Dyadobacter jiangsuensis]
MPIHFIDNYAKHDLESQICKADRTPLYGEIWLYQELLKFNDNGFLRDDNWYVKHNYNLSSHPFSDGKVEGQIDYLILSKFGILIIEIKGGGIGVDQNDVYYSYEKKDHSHRYVAQNPFTQVKEYVHSLKSLLDTNHFIYRAVIFPHENNFILKGPQLSGYHYLFFSKKDLDKRDSEFGKNELLFDFLTSLARTSRRHIIEQLGGVLSKERIEVKSWERFPALGKKDIDRLRSELFPQQATYGFDPNRVKNEIILNENYEILKGLRKNRKTLVQGGPGTGKTVLATKFIAENVIKQQKGVYFCANRLLRAKIEHLICTEYKLDPNKISFHIYHPEMLPKEWPLDVDFVVIDEAQEFFDKGLDKLIENFETKSSFPKFMVLYDPEQAIIQNFKDIDWYADFLLESTFVHYFFDTNWRCTQNNSVVEIASLLKNGQYSRIQKDHSTLFLKATNQVEKLEAVKSIINDIGKDFYKSIILVDSYLIHDFRTLSNDFYRQELEELTHTNINIRTQKIRYTTPLKYKGLESDHVILITSGLNELTKVQAYVGISRAIYSFRCILWSQETN